MSAGVQVMLREALKLTNTRRVTSDLLRDEPSTHIDPRVSVWSSYVHLDLNVAKIVARR